MTPEQLAAALITPRRRAHSPEPAGIGPMALHWHGERTITRRALLVHGWDADHRDMAPLAAAMAQRGLSSLMPDLPAHGLSPGTSVTIAEAAAALVRETRGNGPFEIAIGHSVGAAVLLHAVRDGLAAEDLVLLTPPRNYAAQLASQARAAGAPPTLIAQALDLLRERMPTLDEVDSVVMAPTIRQPALVIAAGQDRVLDPAHGEALAGALRSGLFLLDASADHRSVLISQFVQDAVLARIEQRYPITGCRPSVR